MADEEAIQAIAAVVLPWVTMPNATTGPTNGRPWTAAEHAAYDAAGGWTEGTDAARAVRAQTVATEILQGAAVDVTTIRQWIRCICGHARGRAVEPREDCPECGWRPGTHRPPVKVMHLGVAPCTRYAPEEAPRG